MDQNISSTEDRKWNINNKVWLVHVLTIPFSDESSWIIRSEKSHFFRITEAGSGDALRIKVAELMLAAPQHQAIESTIKDSCIRPIPLSNHKFAIDFG